MSKSKEMLSNIDEFKHVSKEFLEILDSNLTDVTKVDNIYRYIYRTKEVQALFLAYTVQAEPFIFEHNSENPELIMFLDQLLLIDFYIHNLRSIHFKFQTSNKADNKEFIKGIMKVSYEITEKVQKVVKTLHDLTQ